MAGGKSAMRRYVARRGLLTDGDDDFEDEDDETGGWDEDSLRDLMETAVAAFPKLLESTGHESGKPVFSSYGVEWGVEYTCTVGSIWAGTSGSRTIEAAGWFEIRMDDSDSVPNVDCFMILALDGKWKDPKSRLLGEYEGLQGWHNIESDSWEVSIKSM